MEFLDPEEKRAKTIKLFMGYSLALLIVISVTIILSFVVQGVDLFSRQVEVKNGLLFVDSKPVSSDVYIDNELKKRTEAKFVLSEGKYDVKLSQEGYRDWNKRVDVIGSKVRYHVYPKLIPNEIATVAKSNYNENPSIYTQSLDRKWLIVSANKTQPVLQKFDLSKPDAGPVQITLPNSVVSAEEMKTAVFKEIEWSNDNKNVLYQKTIGKTKQYIVINIDKPEESINLTDTLKLNQAQKVAFFDRKFDKYYIHDTANKTLKKADLKNGILPEIILSSLVEYKYYGNKIILYATENPALPEKYNIQILDGDKKYNLESVTKSEKVLLDIAKYENEWYVVVGSGSQEYVGLYLNPMQNSPNPVTEPIKPQLKLRIEAAKFIEFSNNGRFIAAQSESNFAVYDAEVKRVYRFKSPISLPEAGAKWMDGHRLRAVSDNKEQIFEFDGANLQATSSALNGTQSYYDRDYEFSYSLIKDDKEVYKLQQANLVAEIN